jgi:tetratricopeptide (TPR) repeat protein
VPSSPTTETHEASLAEAVERLLSLPEDSSRRSFLQQNPEIQQHSVVVYLASQVPKVARDDVDRALRLAGLASWLAEILDDDYCRARSARAMGHPLQLKGQLRESLAEYQKALDLFRKLKLDSEVAITLSSSLQPLILLGNYEESRVREEKARKIFKAQGDDLRLARLDANLGNILHRQDRFEEAVVLYRRAEASLERFDVPNDLAILLNNMAVCYISLREFPSAVETYRRLRAYSEQRHLQQLIVQADYNIAYLHYLQGEYERAIELYTRTRTLSARAGDPYHAALCDLDQAEIYLHLNLYKECSQLARHALAQFQGLRINYEAAKAYTFLGLAACYETDAGNALELLGKGRELFLLEQNWIWPPLLDLYRAVVLYCAGSWPEALKAVSAAQSVLSHSALKDQAALAELLRSLLHLQLGDSPAAQYWSQLAVERIESSKIAAIRYLGEFVLGRVREGQSDLSGARRHYNKAMSALETVNGQLERQTTKVLLLKNTDPLHQQLISVALRLPGPTLTQKPHLP